MLKIGDSVGMIQKVLCDAQGCQNYWRLVEDKITKISITRAGAKYYAPKKFRPLDAEEVDTNTEIQENAEGFILTGEVFGLNDVTRRKAEQWVEWANKNPDRATSIWAKEAGT